MGGQCINMLGLCSIMYILFPERTMVIHKVIYTRFHVAMITDNHKGTVTSIGHVMDIID